MGPSVVGRAEALSFSGEIGTFLLARDESTFTRWEAKPICEHQVYSPFCGRFCKKTYTVKSSGGLMKQKIKIFEASVAVSSNGFAVS